MACTLVDGDNKFHIVTVKDQYYRKTNCPELRGGSMQSFLFWQLHFTSSER